MYPYISHEYSVAMRMTMIIESEVPLKKNIKLVIKPINAWIPSMEVADWTYRILYPVVDDIFSFTFKIVWMKKRLAPTYISDVMKEMPIL